MFQRKLGEPIVVGQIEVRFWLESSHTGGSLTSFEFRVPAGARVPVPHSHDAFDETIYGIAGTGTWRVGGESLEVGPGEVLFIPRGVVHGFANRGATEMHALAMVTPGLFGPAYFQDIGRLLNAGGPPDPKAIGDVMRRHGLTPEPG